MCDTRVSKYPTPTTRFNPYLSVSISRTLKIKSSRTPSSARTSAGLSPQAMNTPGFVCGSPLPRTQKRSTPANVFMCKKPADPPVASVARKKPKKTVRSNASWANNFLAEFGRKGPGSRPEWDLRPKSLRTEIREDARICSNCDGTGLMTCSFCEGIEFIAADGSVIECPACHGEHLVTCSACFGTGKQVELVRFSLSLTCEMRNRVCPILTGSLY